jgi:type III restriction enzyme
MFKLKKYQQTTIQKLESYLKQTKKLEENGVVDSYKIIFNLLKPDTENDYKSSDPDLEVPFICIKIPTGGGKTVVACNMLNIVHENYIEFDHTGLVIWLVPSDTIRTQTLKSLRDRNHPYRETLDKHFQNNVKIFDVDEALKNLKKSDIENNLSIIVSTMSAFRRKQQNKKNLRVFQGNENLDDFFQNILNDDILEKASDGTIIPHLINVFRKSNPIVIVDEGHNASSDLSRDMLKELNPSFVLEYTATPKDSNVLVSVSAKELQNENMIKLPITLANLDHWEKVVKAGVAERERLEKIAKKEQKSTGEYIRPIALIQAELEIEDKKRTYVQKIIDYLKSDCDISDEEIAIKTATIDEISDIDLRSDQCKIKYILTVNALKEGWDEPFPYVLISVANIESRISVEQTIGRIMRLPNQKLKKNVELNQSFVFVSSRKYEEAASALVKGLKIHGFSSNAIIQKGKKLTEINVFYREKKFIKEKIKIPFFAIKGEKKFRKLTYYEDLIGSDFDLTKQKTKDSFDFHYDESRKQTVDVDQKGKIIWDKPKLFDIKYDDTKFPTEDKRIRLINWLDKTIRRNEYSQQEKRSFLEKNIQNVEKKKYSVQELFKNMYRVREELIKHLNEVELDKALPTFNDLVKKKKISLNSYFLDLPEKIEIGNPDDANFNKHLYTKAGILNSEEKKLAEKIDLHENVKWWYRSIEKDTEHGLYLQGWQRDKFYPDFIVKTKSGKYLLVEYKGENLLTNEDTKYKITLGKKWESLTPSNYLFYLVAKGNTPVTKGMGVLDLIEFGKKLDKL